MRLIGTVACVAVLLAPARAVCQQFQPPGTTNVEKGTRIGLYGFGVRGGFDLTGHDQFIAGASLDLGNLFTSRIRLRPSAEVGVFNGVHTSVGSFEALFRFTDDNQLVQPYLGSGFSLAGRDECGTVTDCPGVWLNFVFGFELHYRSTFNWLLEYHGMDLLQRHRFYVGLTTRRGN